MLGSWRIVCLVRLPFALMVLSPLAVLFSLMFLLLLPLFKLKLQCQYMCCSYILLFILFYLLGLRVTDMVFPHPGSEYV